MRICESVLAKPILWILLFTILPLLSLAQLTTTNLAPYNTPDSLVKNVLLGSGVRAFNIQYNGGAGNAGFVDNGIGYFDNTGATTLSIGIDEGLIMSSGNIAQAVGPNLTGGQSSTLAGNLSDTDLVVLTNGLIRDASVLEFDFIPNSDSVSFRFVFASEEYPEHVGGPYNDPFGFFISGPGISGTYSNSAINIAKVPGTSTEITINTLNAGINGAYYVSNGSGPNGSGTVLSNPDIEFDAFTIPIEVSAIVIPCDTYHIKLAVADVQDRIKNSAVFLEANSFSSSAVTLNVINDYAPYYGDTVLFEGCDSNSFSISRLHGFNASETLFMTIHGDADTNDFTGVPDSIVFAVGDTSVSFNVQAIQDFIVDPNESLILTIFPDTGSCLITDSSVFQLVIREPDPLVSFTLDTQLLCVQVDSLRIGAQILAGQQPYSFQWSTGALTDSFMVDSPMDDTLLFVTVHNGCFSDSIIDSIRIFSSEFDTSFYHTIADTFEVFCNQDTLAMTVSMDSGNTEFIIRWHGSPSVFDSTLHLTPPYLEGFYRYTVMDVCEGTVIDSLVDSVYVMHKIPTAEFGWTSNCVFDSLATFDSSSSVYGTPIVNWFWDFDSDGTIDQSNTPTGTFAFQDTGTFTVQLAIEDSTGCTDTVSHTVLSYPLPTPSFSHANACVFDSVTFSDQSTVPTVSGLSFTVVNWLWDFGDGDTSTLQNPGHAFDSAGTQPVVLTVWSDKGCRDTTSSSLPVISYPHPDVLIGHVNACFMDSVAFSDQTTIPSVSGLAFTSTAWLWEFGNGDSSTAQNPNHSFPSPGNYVVTLTVWSNEGCSDTATNTLPVTTYELPQPDFAANQLCTSDATNFLDLSSSLDGTINDWHWRFFGNDTSVLQNPGYQFPAHDTFSIELTVTTDLGCTDSILKDVVIYDLPAPYFTYNTICQGDSIFFQDASATGSFGPPIFDYFWDLDNDGLVDDMNSFAAYSFGTAIDTHLVELRITDSIGCTDSVVRPIIVNPLPEPALTSTNVCLDAPVNFFDLSTIVSGNVVSWTWAFGEGNDTSFLQNPAHQYANPGSYQIYLQVVSDSGCVSTINDSVSVVVNPLPLTNFTVTNGCLVDSLSMDESSTILSGDIVEWIWYFGDGQTDTVRAPELSGDILYKYANYGFYDVILAAVSDSGCAVQDTQNIQAFEMPDPAIDHQKTCLNALSQFSDSTEMATSAVTAWLWDMGDGSSYTSQHPSHVFSLADTFNVSLIVTSSQGCSDSISVMDTILPLPIPAYTTQNVCQEDTLHLLNQSTSVNGFAIVQNQWDIDTDGITDYSSLNAAHHYSAPGSFDVELLVTDAYGCADSTSMQVAIHPEPVAMFNFSNTCQFLQAGFTDVSALDYGSLVNHTYSFGDGQASDSISAPNHAYLSFGTFAVQLLVETDSGCTDSVTRSIVIHERPVADFSVTDRCLNDSSEFTDLSTIGNGAITSWMWNFDDGQTSALSSETMLYALPNTYQPRLIVHSDSGCYDTVTHSHIVHALPLVQFTLNNICPGESLPLTDASSSQNPFSINQWFWDVDTNGTIDYTLPNAVHNFPFPGTGVHEIELRVEDTYGCTDSLLVSQLVHPQPNAQIATENACLNESVALTDSSTIASGNITHWLWDLSNGDSLYSQNLNYFYLTPGVHAMTLIVTSDSSCSDTASSIVRVYKLPIADFIHQDTCEYDSLHVFSSSSEGDTTLLGYEWDFGDLSPTKLGDPAQHLYSTNANYSVSLLVVDQFSCQARVTKDVEIFEQPDVQFTVLSVCDQDSALFADATTFDSAGSYNVVNWIWDFGDANGASGSPDVAHVYDTAGMFDASLKVVSNAGCWDSLKQIVEIHPLPKPSFAWNDTCAGKPFAFADQSTIAWDALDRWQWSFENGTLTDRHPIVLFDTGGLHDVRLKVYSDFGCVDSILETVDVMYVPQTGYEINMMEACSPAEFELENTTPSIPNNFITYAWTLNGDTLSDAASITQVINNDSRQVTTHSFTLSAHTDEGCWANFTLAESLQVFPLPEADFSADPTETNTYEALVYFTDNSTDAVDWVWDFDADGLLGSLTNEQFDYANFSGDRRVKLTVKNRFECIDTASLMLYIKPEPKIFVPNAFTPDGTSLNDVFQPKYNDINSVLYFQVYDRWGRLMFDGRNIEAAWDGSVDGVPAPLGVYYYEIHYVDDIGRNGFLKGAVNLIR